MKHLGEPEGSVVPGEWSVEALATELEKLAPRAAVVVRAETPSPSYAKLRRALPGAVEVVAYRNTVLQANAELAVSMAEHRLVDVIALTSPLQARALEPYKGSLSKVKIAAIGGATMRVLAEMGLNHVVVPPRPSISALIDEATRTCSGISRSI